MVFCLSEDGDMFVIDAGPAFRVLRKNEVGEMCLATPSVTGDALVIRKAKSLLPIGKAK